MLKTGALSKSYFLYMAGCVSVPKHPNRTQLFCVPFGKNQLLVQKRLPEGMRYQCWQLILLGNYQKGQTNN